MNHFSLLVESFFGHMFLLTHIWATKEMDVWYGEPVGIISSPIVKCFPKALTSRAIQMFQTALHDINLEYMLTLKHRDGAKTVLKT